MDDIDPMYLREVLYRSRHGTIRSLGPTYYVGNNGIIEMNMNDYHYPVKEPQTLSRPKKILGIDIVELDDDIDDDFVAGYITKIPYVPNVRLFSCCRCPPLNDIGIKCVYGYRKWIKKVDVLVFLLHVKILGPSTRDLLRYAHKFIYNVEEITEEEYGNDEDRVGYWC